LVHGRSKPTCPESLSDAVSHAAQRLVGGLMFDGHTC
jgi:hypothetical protein